MAWHSGFWQAGVTGTAANMNNCLLGWGLYSDFPTPAAAPSSPGLTNGTGVATGSPINLSAGANTITITTQGTFTINLTTGNAGIVTSGTSIVTASPVSLTSGSNTITTTGTGTITVGITVTAPGNAGMLALATDRDMIYYSDGSAWQQSAITPPASLAQGDIIYFNGTAWARLGADTAGKVLTTNGAGANPSWAAPVAIAIGGGYDFYGLLSNIPANFHLCDGTALSRTTYAALFTAIGTAFGAGDGSTTFNLPNGVDKFPKGVATSATNPGATGGSVSKTTAGHQHSSAYTSAVYQMGSNQEGLVTPTYLSADSISDIRPPFLERAPIIRIL